MRFLGNSSFRLNPQSLFNYPRKLCSLTSNMPPIRTFVFLDLETTGLPHLEHNLTKITELCAVAVQADHIELGCFPRVHNKLTFCFNPNKLISPQSTEITGLSNQLLEHQSSFSSEIVDIIKKWLDMNQKPICFVAHNGSRFDYPILRAEIEKTGNSLCEDVLCVDSLSAFRQIDKANHAKSTPIVETNQEVPFEFNDGYDELLCQIAEQVELEEQNKLTPEEKQRKNETTPKKQMISSPHTNRNEVAKVSKRVFTNSSFKLGDVYTRLTSKEPITVHEAEADVTMLITCAAVYGEKFVEYANENSVNFSTVRIMKPGAKIGL